MAPHYHAIRPLTDQVGFPGERVAVERLEGERVIEIRIEVTLPERVRLCEAHRVKVKESLFLLREEAEWVFERLRDLLGTG